MQKIKEALAAFGLKDKEIAVYLGLLRLGPSPVRNVAKEAGVNRGTTYDILKSLQEQGLTSYYHKERHQYFVAEDPNKLFDVINFRVDGLKRLREELNGVVPQLRSMSTVVEERPVVTYYDGLAGVRTILQDVLDRTATATPRQYRAYSSASIRQYLYAAYPDFTAERIRRQIAVQVISMGPGGETVGLDERRWLPGKNIAPTYTFIYANRVAMVSTDHRRVPMGLIVVDSGLYETQRLIFEQLWSTLVSKNELK